MNLAIRTALLAICLLLAACPSTVTRKPPERQLSLPPLPAEDLTGATLYAVDPARSDVHVLVYRGGTLARLGHNHVMSSKSVSGRAWMNPQLAKSGFQLTLPVSDLIVDDPETRRAAGADFPPVIPEADRQGTRRNMLRAESLDAERYPTISLRSVSIAGPLTAAKLLTRITIKDVSRDVEVPAKIEVSGSELRALGEFDVQQSAFGITPFSIGMGALQVQDRLRVKFNIVALEIRES